MAAATLRGSSNAKVIQQGFLLVLVSSDRIATIKRVTTGSETALNEIALFVHE
jgi:hypothetical protein